MHKKRVMYRQNETPQSMAADVY